MAIPVLLAAADSPKAAVDELLAADRAFSAASAKTDVVAGLSAMFADDVVMPVPSGQFAEGKGAATAALASNADNAKSRIEWTPVRGGISADLQHGFTLGFMTLHRPDGTDTPLKYLAYWVKKPDGWRVAAYKRNRAGAARARYGEARSSPAGARWSRHRRIPQAIARYKTTLDEAERRFRATRGASAWVPRSRSTAARMPIHLGRANRSRDWSSAWTAVARRRRRQGSAEHAGDDFVGAGQVDCRVERRSSASRSG